MTPGRTRRGVALGGRLLAGVLILAAATGRLPHLVLTQAILTALLTMVAAPLALLDRNTGPSRRRWSIPAFPAVALMSVGTVFFQAPPVVAVIGEGGLLSAAAMGALLLMAMGFWSVVMPPARLRGLAGAAYVIAGSLPISMPAMFLLTLPRDIYGAFHAAAASPLPGLEDQIYSGFVLFVSVKVTLFVAFTFLFLSAASEKAEGGGDDHGGDREARRPPTLPGWVKALLEGEPTVDEPAVRVVTGAGSR
ncbi:MAG: hypothetical protein NVSMB17_06830 [Candidatus Dormibacteria bacterium]